MLLIQLLVIALVLVVPLWRVFQRAGLNPALSLFAIIPGLGGLVALALLAFLRWPATEPGRSGTSP
jgi:hypothetical protein